MSTRRSTRASGSKQPSPVPSATPSRASRVSRASATPRKASLPTTRTKTSTAYGTNAIAQPTDSEGPQISYQIENVLGRIMEPIAEDGPAPSVSGYATRSQVSAARVPARRAASNDPNISADFGQESAVFGDGAVDASGLVGEPEQPAPIVETLAQQAQNAVLESAARQGRYTFGSIRAGLATTLRDGISWVQDRVDLPHEIVTSSLKYLLGLAVLAAVVVVLLPSNGIHNYGMSLEGMKHNFGQFIPFGANPLNHGDAAQLAARITKAEQEILLLKKRSALTSGSIQKLQSILPDFIVGTKDNFGNTILPSGLWSAIQDKIKSDQSLLSSPSDKAVASRKDIEKLVDKKWNKFVKENAVKSKAVVGANVDKQFTQLLDQAVKSETILSKAKVIDLVRESWEDNQVKIKTEIDTATKDIGKLIQSVSKLQDNSTHTTSEIKAIINDAVHQMLPVVQLQALASTNIQANLHYGLNRVNYFSPGTGAIVNPFHTSPNYVFPEQKVGLLTRFRSNFGPNKIPVPKSPSTALTKWEEHGDCWCSPAYHGNNLNPTLGVIIVNNIYPEEIIVEHLVQTAVLEPRATPKDMDLLAYIADPELLISIREQSDELFPEESESEPSLTLPQGYVRVATFSYDQASASNIQAFPIQLDLKTLGASTNKFIVRSKSNWGGDYTCFYRLRLHGQKTELTSTE